MSKKLKWEEGKSDKKERKIVEPRRKKSKKEISGQRKASENHFVD